MIRPRSPPKKTLNIQSNLKKGVLFMNITKKNLSKQILSIGAATLMTVNMLSPALAANPTGRTDTIDTSKACSLTLYKYNLTAAEKAGIDVSSYVATGEMDTAAMTALAPYALEGEDFSLKKIGDIATYTDSGHIELGVSAPSSLLSLLDISSSDSITTISGVNYYSPDTISAGLRSAMTNDTEGKDKIEAWFDAQDSSVIQMAPTDSNGKTSKSGLTVGLYMLCETSVTQNVTKTTAPAIITLPMTDPTGEAWNYDVYAFLKDWTEVVKVEKKVMENETDGYQDTVTASEGDTLKYTVSAYVPSVTSTATYLTKLDFTDTLSKGLEYNNDMVVKFYTNEADAENAAGNAVAEWTATASPAMFTTTATSDGNGTKLTIKPTASGFNKLNTALSGKYMSLQYSCTLTSAADTVLGDKGNTNDVKLLWQRTNDHNEELKDEAIVNSYGLNITKTFSDNQGDATNVQFVLKNVTDGYYVTADGSNGNYYAKGQATTQDAGTVFSPASNGNLKINGLEADTYELTEIHTDAGYSLLKEPMTIVISKTKTTIVPAKSALTGDAKTAMSVTMNTSASASVDGNSTAMSADGTSANARTDMNILNTHVLTPPQTGDAGTYAAVFGGVALFAIGLYALFAKKKAE